MQIQNSSIAAGIGKTGNTKPAKMKSNRVEIHAIAEPEQTQVLWRLHRTVAESGGWVLHRVCARRGLARMVFEFPRDICIDVYAAMVSLGLELSTASHRLMADLCLCTPYLFDLSSRSITVEDDASLDKATRYICSLEFVEIDLAISFSRLPGQSAFCAENAA